MPTLSRPRCGCEPVVEAFGPDGGVAFAALAGAWMGGGEPMAAGKVETHPSCSFTVANHPPLLFDRIYYTGTEKVWTMYRPLPTQSSMAGCTPHRIASQRLLGARLSS